MAVSSYGSATRSSGVVRIIKDLDLDLTDRHVLIVEDIVDSGLTLAYLRKNLAARSPASLEVCALLVKEGLQRVELDLKYVGFRIPPEFVVGYGLDVDERYRNLPFIAEYAGASVSLAAGAPRAADLGASLVPGECLTRSARLAAASPAHWGLLVCGAHECRDWTRVRRGLGVSTRFLPRNRRSR